MNKTEAQRKAEEAKRKVIWEFFQYWRTAQGQLERLGTLEETAARTAPPPPRVLTALVAGVVEEACRETSSAPSTDLVKLWVAAQQQAQAAGVDAVLVRESLLLAVEVAAVKGATPQAARRDTALGLAMSLLMRKDGEGGLAPGVGQGEGRREV